MPEDQYKCNTCGWIFPESEIEVDCCPQCSSADIELHDPDEE